MPVLFSEEFSNRDEWIEMAEHANQLLQDYGYYNYEIMVRPATKEELQSLKLESTEVFVTALFDASKCCLDVLLSGSGSPSEWSLFNEITPKEFAEYNVVDTLDQFINGSDPLDPENFGSGRGFRVINGGKNSE